MKKKNIFLVIVVMMLTWTEMLQAQQLPMFSQFMLNDYFQNPAVAGSRPYFDAVSANRLQWVGIPDAPRTYALSMHGPIKNKNMGVGGYLFTDIAGPTRRIGFSGSYAYHLKLNETLKLSLSVSGGAMQFAVDASKLTLDNTGDYVFANGYQSKVVPDLGTSFYLYSQPNESGAGNFWFGAYVPQVFPAKLKLFETPDPTGKLATHFYLIGGYRAGISDDFVAEPSLLIKYVSPVPVQVDIAARFIYKNKFWLGAGYRTADAMMAMVGYNHKDNLSIGYSFDFNTSGLKKYSQGSHELMLSFRFNPPASSSAPKDTE